MALRGRRDIKEQKDDKSIEINAQMQGSLTFKDPVNLKINGSFTGDLQTCGSLSIGDAARVQANIEGDSIVIGGRVTGDITASKMLVLLPTAILNGNITTPKLNIVEGAVFQGHCKMAEENLLNIDEVSKYLEIAINEIEQLANSGKIPGIRKGNAWKFEKSQIDNWASSAEVK